MLQLRSCADSELWARRMVDARPFRMLEDLYEAADTAWFALLESEWISAFSTLADDTTAAGEKKKDIEQATRLYHEKFGFIFVVGKNGKSPEELLAICKARLDNSVETELQIASEEYRKIIELRLNRLLEQ